MKAQLLIDTPVVVFGPADLFTTAVASALEAHGMSVERSVEPGRERADGGSRPAVAVVDVSGRVDAMRQVAVALAAGYRVLLVSDDGRSPRVAAAMVAGAAGWVSAMKPVKAMVEAVRELADGRPIASADDRAAWARLDAGFAAAARERKRLLDSLTDREFTVLRGLERGHRAADIAETNVVALTTVRSQIRSILKKLHVNRQEDAVALYRDALRAKSDRLT